MKFLIDTSALIGYAKNDAEAVRAVLGTEGVLTSALCSYEIMVGSPKSKKSKLEGLLTELMPLPFTFRDARRAAAICESMSNQGKTVNVIDVLIYAQAMERGLGIMTKDKDFMIINDTAKGNLTITELAE